MNNTWKKWDIAEDIRGILDNAQSVIMPKTRAEILSMAVGGDNDRFDVSYQVDGKGLVTEATVARCKNGLVVNYPENYMRRRDPDSMVIGDSLDTDKPRFKDLYGKPFDTIREESFAWLKKQHLAVIAIRIGGKETGYFGLLIAPANAGFFIGGLADLQGMVEPQLVPANFKPEAIVYLVPPFRHTHFKGKQIVVHNRLQGLHEIFSYNLYPGPSAKKGIYGVLLQIGENENWLTLHGSTVQVVTPYDNITTIIHEGASGGGKSEMLEYPHREHDGRLLLGLNRVSGEKFRLGLTQSCDLKPVTDDMALSLKHYSSEENKLMVYDAEESWFIRLDHIKHYGTDPQIENMCIHAQEPLIFLNIEGTPGSTALIWEHTEDAPGKRCPNPRVILPRRFINDVVNNPVEVDFRSFGIRAPLCTKEAPTYGVFGMLHILPPALAWLWRLVAPRGDKNPSITDSSGLVSEGVGSFWPFATGKLTNQANLLLQQIMETAQTRHVLLANQHIGSWEVSFMPQWLSREFLARRGAAKFRPEQLIAARCPLLGYVPANMRIEGTLIPEYFFQVDKQPEVGTEAYDIGVAQLVQFFHAELKNYLQPDLSPLGKKIIECCLNNGTLQDYMDLTPMTF